MSIYPAETTPSPPGEHPEPSVIPRYDLDQDELHGLTGQLHSEIPPTNRDRFVCYQFEGTSPYSNLGRAVERQVFEASFGNDSDEMHAEYGPYEDASTLWVITDKKDELPVGAYRVIKNSPVGLKSLNDIAAGPLAISTEEFQAYHGVESLDGVWDMGTMAILRGYRSYRDKLLSATLFRGLYVAAEEKGIEHYISVADTRVHNKTKMLGLPFESICGSEPFSYLGSASSTAIYGHAPDFPAAVDEHLADVRLQNPVVGFFLKKHILRLSMGKDTDEMLMPASQ